MLDKKATIIRLDERNPQKQLAVLYARRSAIDAVIESLETYDRFRAKSASELPKRKTA